MLKNVFSVEKCVPKGIQQKFFDLELKFAMGSPSPAVSTRGGTLASMEATLSNVQFKMKKCRLRGEVPL